MVDDKIKQGNSLKEILLNERATDLLLLTDEAGTECHYKQIATILRYGEIYCILRPLSSMYKKGEAVLFKYTPEGELVAQADRELAMEIFTAYKRELRRAKQAKNIKA